MRRFMQLFTYGSFWHFFLLLFLFLLLQCSPRSVDAGCSISNSGGLVEWPAVRHGRTLLQSNVSTDFLVLAEERTARRDPLNNFDVYRDGWDVRNEHYWASAGYTGAPGFVLAALWLALGLALLLFVCCCCCCCRRRLKGAHRGQNCLPLVFLLLFTAVAVVGCGFVYIGQGKSHNELSDTLDYVVHESDVVVVKLRNTSAVLVEAQSITVLQFALSNTRKDQIQQLNTQLNNAADTLATKTQDNAHNISDALNSVRLAMIVVAGVMLLLILLGFLFSVLGITVLMYMLVLIVWILVAATWILCGVYIMLNNVVGDTCISMGEWVGHPSAQTSLQDILPCVDINTTDRALDQTRAVENDTINGINTAIQVILNNGSQTQGLPLMCNPLLQTGENPPNCVNILAVSEEWLPFVCSNQSSSQACALGGRLTPQIYEQLNRSMAVVNGLNNNIPFLLDLLNCNFVRQVFTTIKQDHCHPLREYLKWQYIGLALISGGFMFSIWLWIVFNRHRRHRFFHHIEEEQNPQFMSRGFAPQQTPPKAAA